MVGHLQRTLLVGVSGERRVGYQAQADLRRHAPPDVATESPRAQLEWAEPSLAMRVDGPSAQSGRKADPHGEEGALCHRDAEENPRDAPYRYPRNAHGIRVVTGSPTEMCLPVEPRKVGPAPKHRPRRRRVRRRGASGGGSARSRSRHRRASR